MIDSQGVVSFSYSLVGIQIFAVCGVNGYVSFLVLTGIVGLYD